MISTDFDLLVPEHAYIFGFLQADGHMSQTTRNRGRISLELSARDEKLIQDFHNILPIKSTIKYRTRNTNFKNNYSSVTLNIFDLKFRTKINKFGLPYGRKSNKIKIPTCNYCERDYWRGIIDADGTIGISAKERLFIGLVTDSDNISKSFHELIFKVCNQQYNFHRNKRDNIYNITIFQYNAALLCKYLYYPNCLSLLRKYNAAQDIINKY